MSGRLARGVAVGTALLGVAAVVVVVATTGWAPPEEGGAPVALQLLITTVGFGFMGAFLILRRPENRVGWLLAGVGVCESVGSIAETVGGSIGEEHLQVALTLVLLGRMTQEFSIVLAVVLLPALFPTGEVPTARWRWLPPTALVVGVLSQVSLFLLPDELMLGPRTHANPYGLESAQGPITVLASTSFVGMLLLALPAVASLVLRFRRAVGVERQQLRWFALSMVSLAGSVIVMILWATAWNLGLLPNPSNLTFDVVVGLGAMTVPISVGAAVLRYRLFDIDRIVSRAVVYVVVVGLLAGGYLLLVLGLGTAARELTGESGDLVVAASTLVVAVAAGPLLRRIREVVDRRFNRARYDAARTVGAFGRELRDEVSLDAIVQGLRTTTAGTVEPAVVSVYLVERAP